ncbi:MAG: hypothetical protein JO360_05185 [Acidobacteria bacterium]|nr:hypothetical protein [Acidobacteriota bacterium]
MEQRAGPGTDQRSDLYSLGATLYHLLTNRLPPDALEARAANLALGLGDPLHLACEFNPQIPEPVAQVLHRAMAFEAAHRYASAAEMRQALQTAVAEEERRRAAEKARLQAEAQAQREKEEAERRIEAERGTKLALAQNRAVMQIFKELHRQMPVLRHGQEWNALYRLIETRWNAEQLSGPSNTEALVDQLKKSKAFREILNQAKEEHSLKLDRWHVKAKKDRRAQLKEWPALVGIGLSMINLMGLGVILLLKLSGSLTQDVAIFSSLGFIPFSLLSILGLEDVIKNEFLSTPLIDQGEDLVFFAPLFGMILINILALFIGVSDGVFVLLQIYGASR